jgi:type IV pilus assembly protein PilO
MGDLARIRKRFIAAAAVMGAISLGLLGYLLWPQSRGPRPADLQEQYLSLKSEVALWKKGNPDVVRADLKRFYSEDVPERYSAISQRMEKLFEASGVSAGAGIRYASDNQDKSMLPGVALVRVETTVTGDYAKVAHFINALERDKVFFIIDKISLSSHEGGTVSLVITVDTFLRQTA